MIPGLNVSLKHPSNHWRRVLVLTSVLSLAAFAPAVAQGLDQTGGVEILYLTNSGISNEQGEPVTELLVLEIDETLGTAEALVEAVLPIEQVDAFACEPDDSRCYLFSKYQEGPFPNGGQIGVYDRFDGSFSLVGSLNDALTGSILPEVVLAAHQPGPEGELFVGSMATDQIYRVDIESASAEALGFVTVSGTNVQLNLSGADMSFNAVGTWFLWTNGNNGPQAPDGLYEIRQEVFGGLEAIYLGIGEDGIDPDSQRFTGLAVRANGTGNFVGSNRFDELHEQDGSGQDVDYYNLLVDGEPLGHLSGDMHHAYDCFLESELDAAELVAGEDFSFTVRLVHNRPTTVVVPLRITVLDGDGFEVVQFNSRPITFDWGTDLAATVNARLPETIQPGTYQLEVAFEQMRQGEAIVRHEVTVR